MSAEAALALAKAGAVPIEKNAPNAASAATTRRWIRLATKIPVLCFAAPPGTAANPRADRRSGLREHYFEMVGTPRRLVDCGLTGQMFNKQVHRRH